MDETWAITGAAVVVVRSGQLLMVMEQESRPDVHKKPNMASVPMGATKPGETIRENARREFREEAGYEVELLYPVGFFTIDMADYERVGIWAFAGEPGQQLGRPTSPSVRGPIWIPLRDFLNIPTHLVRPRVQEMVAAHQYLEVVCRDHGINYVTDLVLRSAPTAAKQLLLRE
ncbi:hypothetical protein A2V68_02095 [candidate division Kazan bacterium RBG_13_50_9]|uniref:Nudix hydrolase domain-containing protein n=1 Tax=candidate division Kazan bacterium RBG_13_50_9 TaxID=1798535 RepID=A0A1F4NRJ3_UNCK3|nr:MAG: hypothetical protein A2V68_02095 [candidate division Kazan bacterium RBG_13_50_9]